jgi:hypothetical protein
VTFRDDKCFVGDAKKNQAMMNLTNTVLKFSDPIIQTDFQNWSFKIICDDSDRPEKEVE